MDFKHLVVPNSCNHFNLFQFEVKLGSRSKSQDTSSHWTFCDGMLASGFQSCCLPLHVRSCLFREFQEAHPSTKSGSLKTSTDTTQHPKAQHENHLQMYEPLLSPRQSHSQNDPKTLPGPRPFLSAASTLAPAEISCSTTAAWPFAAATCSAVLPRAPRMRRGRSSSCDNGTFLRVVGQNYRS